jgi:hypothetical protein
VIAVMVSSFCVKCGDLILLIETCGSKFIFLYLLLVVDTFTGYYGS